ncbi:unnamed protein product [Clavelina lepadiformis]|uniref:Toll-like receptor 3 n=1 Tax=Clavelina lepadiformis TaxID=159417 RepID=A0ABP0GEG7_CLALP
MGGESFKQAAERDDLLTLTSPLASNRVQLKHKNVCPKNFTITQAFSSSLQILDLNCNDWKIIPGNLLGKQLKIFTLTLNPFRRLRKNDFVNATSLEVLVLNIVTCTTRKSLIIEDGVFGPLPHLKYLNLSWNAVQFLQSGIFKNNKNLETLDLSYNSLKCTIFEPTYLVNLQKPRFVDLSTNNAAHSESAKLVTAVKLLRLGQPFASLSSLEEIYFGNDENALNTILYSVQFYEIDNQSFANLSNLTHLSTIDISYCNVHHISSDAWSGLRHLKSIRASNNHIDLSHNPINRIDPFTFSSLSSLRRIDFVEEHTDLALDFNFLFHLNSSTQIKLKCWMPECLVALLFETLSELDENSSLLELDIAQNDLSCKSTYKGKGLFKFMPKLKSLVLRNCEIDSFILHYSLQGLNHLEILDLSHNNLATFPSTPLKILNQLHSLNLDLNNIIELNGNLTVYPNLKHFTIAHNQIKFIQPEFFLHFKLETLDLSHNFINQLDSSIFTKDVLKSLQYLDIRWNELDCFCHEWQEFYRWFNSDASDNTKLPGFYPECTSIID